MARIAGVDIPNEKNIGISLTYIYGIGRPTAAKILAEAGIDPEKRVKNCLWCKCLKISGLLKMSEKTLKKCLKKLQKNLEVKKKVVPLQPV